MAAPRRSDALSRERIVGAAIEILDADGERGLTVRALSSHLATGRGAIYHHVPGMDNLLAAAADEVVRAVTERVAVGADPASGIRALSLGIFDAIDAHPWVGAQLAREPRQPAVLRIWSGIGAYLRGLGVAGSAASDAGAALANHVFGAAAQFAAGARRAGDGADRQRHLDALAAAWTDRDQGDVAREAAAELRVHDDRDQFLAGVDILLGGITARAGGTGTAARQHPDPFGRFGLDALRRRTSMKWRTYPDDVLPCWVAELDVEIAGPVVDAVARAMADGDTGYPAGDAYATALAGFAAGRWGWDVDPSRTALMPDVMRGAVELLGLVSGRGDAVVVNPPVYPPFYEYVELSGRAVVEAPLGPSGRLDLDALEEAFARAGAGGRTAAYLLCSPQNPTGVVHTRSELEAVARLADAHGVRVIADEIHAPLVADGVVFVPYLTVPGTGGAFALHSASKAWNLPGLKAAVAVAGAVAAPELSRLSEEVAIGASHVAVIAHCAALRDGTEWLDRLLAGLDGNRRLLAGLLVEHLPRVRWTPGEATYLAWLDCRDLGLGDDPAATFLERGRVALTSGPAFGPGGAGFARLNLGTSPALIEEAVRRMASTVDVARRP